MARLRAAAGGQMVGGKFFKGGQFVTNEAQQMQLIMDGKAKMNDTAIKKAMERVSYDGIRHALGSIRKAAMASIVTSDKPSKPGGPIHTRKGRSRRAILYHGDKWSGVVGFAYNKIGPSMAAHEHGRGRGKTKRYPKRPTMLPAMMSSMDRFPRYMRGVLG